MPYKEIPKKLKKKKKKDSGFENFFSKRLLKSSRLASLSHTLPCLQSELSVGEGTRKTTLGTWLGIVLQGASMAFGAVRLDRIRFCLQPQPTPAFVNAFSDCIWKKSSG